MGGPKSNLPGVLIRRGNLDAHRDTRDVGTQGKARPGHREKRAIYSQGEASGETKVANTFILDFQPPGL